jgi:clan AA aspartic protease
MKKDSQMGKFNEEITLVNYRDEALVAAGAVKKARQVTLNAVVDTGAMTLVINETTRKALGLGIVGSRPAQVADGRRVDSKVTTPVSIRWKNRAMTCEARVVAGAKRTLRGAIPLEGLDLMVDMVNQRLVGVHGDLPLDEID